MPANPFLVRHGASWVMPDGRVIHLQGFHDAWLRAHPGLSSGAKNTAEFVQKSGWASVVLHEAGYFEIILRDLSSPAAQDFLWNILRANNETLQKAVVMVLGEEGYIAFSKENSVDKERFAAVLSAARA